MEERGRGELDRSEVVVDWARVPARGLGRGSAALVGPLEGTRVASKGLGPLPRIKRGSLGRGCGREGSRALPLPRAAVISTRLRYGSGTVSCRAARQCSSMWLGQKPSSHEQRAWLGLGLGLGLGSHEQRAWWLLGPW